MSLRERVARLPLRWQIGSLVVVGLVVVFLLFGLLGRAIAEDAKQRTVNEWASIATSTASVIDSEIQIQYQRLDQVASALAAAGDPASQVRILQGSSGAGGSLDGQAVFVASDGTVVWPRDGGPLAAFVASDLAARGPTASGRYASGIRDLGGRAVVVLAVPVTDGGRSRGTLALVVSPSAGVIQDLVSSARGLAHTGHAELVDQNDLVIASTDPSDVFRSGEHPDFYAPHLSHRTSGAGLTEPVGPGDPADQGQRHDMAFVSLRSVPWGLALGGSDAELSADVARWETETIALGGISLVVALVLVWLTTRSVARPVLALAAASRRIAGGDLGTPVPTDGEGEVRVLAQAFDHMREKLRNALSELALEKSRYEGIVTSMADAVVTIDAEDRITAFNPAAAALTGVRAEDALGRKSADVVHARRANGAGAALTPHAGVDRIALHRGDGSDAAVALTGAGIRDSEGAPAGTVFVLRDVTAEAEVERMKEEFLATVSHELRTPLGFIMGYATSLLLPDAPDDPATTRRFLRVIADSSKELEALVDDLLDMTKIGSGTLSVSQRPIALRSLVAAAVERARGRERGHRIVPAVPSGLPLVLVDPRRIEQVLYDLLDNAIKYSPDGGMIRVSAARSGSHVTVSVVDHGLGIRSDELTAVFERFHRGRVARARGIAGTGLGLTICRGIVEAHGGRIWAESPPADGRPGDGQGTAIRFTVPVAPADLGDTEERTTDGAEAVSR